MLVKALLFWNFFKSEMASLISFNTSELIITVTSTNSFSISMLINKNVKAISTKWWAPRVTLTRERRISPPTLIFYQQHTSAQPKEIYSTFYLLNIFKIYLRNTLSDCYS